MQIIDTDLFIGTCPFDPHIACNAPQLAQSLNVIGIERGLVSSLNSLFTSNNIQTSDKFLQEISPFADHLWPLLVINPILPDWEQALSLFSEKIFGVTLFPRFHRYSLWENKLKVFYDVILRLNKPLNISLRLFDERTMPQGLDIMPVIEVGTCVQLADKYSKINFVFSSVTNMEADELLSSRKENVCITTSFLEGEGLLEKFIRSSYTANILFGSHFPFFYLESAKAKLESPRISKGAKSLVFQKNAQEIF